MIKKGLFTLVLFAINILAFSQSQHVTSAAIILKQYESEKDKSIQARKIEEAKEFIDKAYANERFERCRSLLSSIDFSMHLSVVGKAGA